MSKSDTKAKLTLIQNRKRKARPSPKEVSLTNTSESQSLEQLATVEFWKQEIANLKSGSFTSVEQATEKLIDQVMDRLKLQKQGEEDVKEFLRLVFESSEVLHTALRNSLGLK